MRCSVFLTSTLYFLNIDTALAQAGVLCQYSTVSALLAGYYDGDINISQLRQHGDSGLAYR